MHSWEDFWELGVKTTEQVLRQKGSMRVTRVQPSEHPALHKHLKELAGKFGLEYTPNVVVTDSLPFLGPVWMRKMSNAAGNPLLKTVIVSESMMDLTHTSLHQRMSPKLETIMAHEFSHLKYDGLSSVLTHWSPYLAPAIGITGLYLYDRARARAQQGPEASNKTEYVTNMQTALHAEADAELKRLDHEKESPRHTWDVDPEWKKMLVNVTRYAAAAALATAAGLWMARHSSLAREYRADRLAVELTGEAEAFKEVLLRVHQDGAAIAKKHPNPETLMEHTKQQWHKLVSLTTHAHPTLPQRLSHIDKIAAERSLSAGFAHIPG